MKQQLHHINQLTKIRLAIAVMVLFSLALQAQKPIRSNIRVDVGIPIITSNYVLRQSFTEIIDINASYHFSIGKKITVGPALSYTHFTVDSFTYDGYRTRTHIFTPAVDVGYQAYMGENSVFTGSIQVGYAANRFSNYTPIDTMAARTSPNFNALSIEPMVRFYFFTGERLALGFKLSYKMIFGHTDYRNLYFDLKNDNFTEKQNSGSTQYMTAGVIMLIGTSKKNVKQ